MHFEFGSQTHAEVEARHYAGRESINTATAGLRIRKPKPSPIQSCGKGQKIFFKKIADGVLLQPLEPWRAQEFADHLERAREHIRPWVGPAFVTDSVDGARATLQRYADTEAADGARIFGLWQSGTLIGGVMFVTFDANWGICEIGCWLEPGGQGQGLITAAVCCLLEWAFTERGVVRAEWRCRTDNTKSIAIAARLNMHTDGILRSSWKFEGQRFDKQVFSLLHTEWPGEHLALQRAEP